MSILQERASAETPLLKLEHVYRVYSQGDSSLAVLKDINLSLRSGEFVAIMGQSGSGKTTLMNILGCLDRPSSGRYLVQGRDVAELDPDELSALRREVFGFVFQRYNLLAGSTALENVEMPAVYAGLPPEERQTRGTELLIRLGMAARLGHTPAQLSGGQQQRVSIARALMNGGKVILADEPTGALDRQSGQEVLALLEELHQAGHTVILITHDAEVAARARRVITISDGVCVSDTGAEPDLSTGSAGPQEAAALPAPSRLPLLSAVGMSIRALKDNRFRTMLTLLGIIIGVASVVAMLALGNGAKEKVLSSIASMGSDLIMVRPAPGSSRSSSGSVQLVDSDIAALRGLRGVLAAVGEDSGSVSVRYQQSDYQTSYTATGVDKPVVANWKLAAGEFFTEEDVVSSAPVAVLGQTVVNHIFPDGQNPVGSYIMIRNVPFLVIGVMEAKGASAFGNDEDDVLLVPVSTARLRLEGRNYLRSAIIKAEAGGDMNALQAEIEALLLERHGTSDFRVMNTAAIMEAASESQSALTMLLGSVAAISLLVGGIGVMNIMLVSVVERTREIGIRMACGARQRDILSQFIAEALLVCILGGVLGVVLGLGAAFLAQYNGASVMYSLPPVLLALGCSLGTGLLFGYAPARKAARLDPVAALASE